MSKPCKFKEAPLKSHYLFAVGLSSMKMIADKQKHAAYHNKH